MIFANSLPHAKAFFAAARLPDSTLDLLTRFVVACLNTLRSASQAADAIRTDPRHRAQLVRFLARQGWSKDWLTLGRLADALLDACLHEQGDWLFLLDQTTHTTLGRHAQNTYSCRNTKRRKKNSGRKQKKTPPGSTTSSSAACSSPPRRARASLACGLTTPRSIAGSRPPGAGPARPPSPPRP